MVVYSGSNLVPMTATFDTGSDWLILQSAYNCSSCAGDTYDETLSTSYS